MILKDAKNMMLGRRQIDRVYLGTNIVWAKRYYLYKDGQQDRTLADGFRSRVTNTNQSFALFYAKYIEAQATFRYGYYNSTVYVVTNNKIDLTRYSTLVLHITTLERRGDAPYLYDASYTPRVTLFAHDGNIDEINQYAADTSLNYSVAFPKTDIGEDTDITIKLDISSISGNYYCGFRLFTSTNSTVQSYLNATVDKIYLE